MEYLGHTFQTPSRDRDGEWKPVEIVYQDDCDFNEATSKLIRMFSHPNGDGKCIVSDTNNERHILENVHVTFDVYGNSIKLFPIECRRLKN
jgi:hypothetical protein